MTQWRILYVAIQHVEQVVEGLLIERGCSRSLAASIIVWRFGVPPLQVVLALFLLNSVKHLGRDWWLYYNKIWSPVFYTF